MSIISTGSRLIAKSQPGAALRQKEETQIENPMIPGVGDIGTVARGMVEEPLNRQTPAGSSKVISSTPTVEPNAIPDIGMTVPNQPLAPTAPNVGLNAPSTPARGVTSAPASMAGGPTLRSNITPAGPMAQGVSGGEVLGAGIAKAYQPIPEPTPMPIQAQASGGNNNQVYNALSGLIGSKAFAGEGANPIRSTLGQAVAGPVGKVLTNVGTALKLPQLSPGGLGNQLQSLGGAASAAQGGIGSVSKTVQNVVNALRSTASNVTNKASSWLRSLFGGSSW
jgi:hypothetical protein